MSWLRSTAGANKIHKLNHCHICAMFLILLEREKEEFVEKILVSKKTEIDCNFF